MDASLHQPASLLPWILAVESIRSFCTSTGAKHRWMLIVIWCVSRAPSPSCTSKYVVVSYLSLWNGWKLYNMSTIWGGFFFLFPTLSLLVMWLPSFLDHKLRIRLVVYTLLLFSAPVVTSTTNWQFSINFFIFILWLIQYINALKVHLFNWDISLLNGTWVSWIELNELNFSAQCIYCFSGMVTKKPKNEPFQPSFQALADQCCSDHTKFLNRKSNPFMDWYQPKSLISLSYFI